jgi:DNA-binding MarR family transcriptional regulator
VDLRNKRCRTCEGARRTGLKNKPLTDKQRRLLAFINANPFCSQQNMAAFMGVTQRAISTMLHRMVAAGAVKHSGGKPRDWQAR